MKIVDNRTQQLSHFSSLSPGDIFSFNNTVYMKITDLEDPKSACYGRAVNMDGVPIVFGQESRVTKLDCELVINGNL